MTTEPDRIDLSALDPELDPDRLERVVTGVLDRLGPGPVTDHPSLLDDVSEWLTGRARPLAAAAALVALISASLLALDRGPDEARLALAPQAREQQLPWNAWLASGEPPRTEALLLSLPRGGR